MEKLVRAIDDAQVKIEQAFGQCDTVQDATALWAALQEAVDFSARTNLKRVGDIPRIDRGRYSYAFASASSSSQ